MPIDPVEGVRIYSVELGKIGQDRDASCKIINDDIANMVPKLENCLAKGYIKPMEYDLVDGVGVEVVLKGIEIFNARKGGVKKVLVKVAQE